MDLYSFQSYKDYLTRRVKAMPSNGHGQFTRIAEFISVSPVVITQVLKGNRDFTEEQALGVAQFLGLQTLETEFFLRLVALSRAGTHELKQFHVEALAGLRRRATKVKNRIKTYQDLDDSTKSIFYSDWTYSAVRLLTSMDKCSSIDTIAEHLQLSRARVTEIMDFLLSVGLCTQTKDGQVKMGIASTHLDAQSRFINTHRRNWRLKGLEALNRTTPEELFFSAPCTLSAADFQVIKSEILALIASLTKCVPTSEPENLACLNIDWFRI